MELLIFSDSHGYAKGMAEALAQAGVADAVCHLGDGFRDAARLSALSPFAAWHSVCGNCDGLAEPEELLIATPAGKLLLTHGHLHGVKSGLAPLADYARSIGAAGCLFGHTHIPYAAYHGGLLLMNPGSVAFPNATRYPTYGVLSCDEGGFDARIVEMTPYGARPLGT